MSLYLKDILLNVAHWLFYIFVRICNKVVNMKEQWIINFFDKGMNFYLLSHERHSN